jgi:hypothetical protein
MMTAEITIEEISAEAVRGTLVADFQISGNLNPFSHPETAWDPARRGARDAAQANGVQDREHELLTVEETAEIGAAQGREAGRGYNHAWK